MDPAVSAVRIGTSQRAGAVVSPYRVTLVVQRGGYTWREGSQGGHQPLGRHHGVWRAKAVAAIEGQRESRASSRTMLPAPESGSETPCDVIVLAQPDGLLCARSDGFDFRAKLPGAECWTDAGWPTGRGMAMNMRRWNVPTLVRRKWMRLAMGKERRNANHGRFDRLYLYRNPWRMDSLAEQYRFRATNRIVLEEFGRVGSVLEVGCGEGHQSVHLTRVCSSLVGLDVSRRAVERARKRCPSARFVVGDICSGYASGSEPFDLLVACEVLYYVPDTQSVVDTMRKLANRVLVTYFSEEMAKLDPIFLPFCEGSREIVGPQASRWRVVWFRGRLSGTK